MPVFSNPLTTNWSSRKRGERDSLSWNRGLKGSFFDFFCILELSWGDVLEILGFFDADNLADADESGNHGLKRKNRVLRDVRKRVDLAKADAIEDGLAR